MLTLNGSRITGERLNELRDLPLRRLELGKCDELTSEGLAQAAGLSHLKNLELSAPRITNSDLKRLAGTKLQELKLAAPNVSDAGIDDLSRLTSLRSLWLTSTQISHRGYEKLK